MIRPDRQSVWHAARLLLIAAAAVLVQAAAYAQSPPTGNFCFDGTATLDTSVPQHKLPVHFTTTVSISPLGDGIYIYSSQTLDYPPYESLISCNGLGQVSAASVLTFEVVCGGAGSQIYGFNLTGTEQINIMFETPGSLNGDYWGTYEYVVIPGGSRVEHGYVVVTGTLAQVPCP